MAMNWVEVQALANAVLVLTSAGAIGYAAVQLRHERGYRAVDNLEKQLSFFLGETYLGARKRLAAERTDRKELLPWDPEEPPVAALEVLDFYEHLGLLVKKGHLDVYDVWHTFYEWAQPVYVDLKPLIEAQDGPFMDHYADLQALMRTMDDIQLKQMHAKNANHWALFTQDRILDYYRYELDAGRPSRRFQRAHAKRRAAERAAETPILVDEFGNEVEANAGGQ